MIRENIITNVKIADDTINMIVGIATTSVDGVASLGEGVTFKALPFIGSKNLQKGVTVVKNDDGSIKVTVTITLRQGSNLKKVCYDVQERVSEAIESMLNIKTRDVVVKVARLDDV